jgi:hypothetical protein
VNGHRHTAVGARLNEAASSTRSALDASRRFCFFFERVASKNSIIGVIASEARRNLDLRHAQSVA